MSGPTLPPRAGERASDCSVPPFAESTSPLALAYAAYRRTAPSEREVSLAVVRLQARLGGTRRRFRAGPLLAFAVVFVGALAYAAGTLINGGAPHDRPPSAVSRASKPQAARPLGEQPDRPSIASSPHQATAHDQNAGVDPGSHAEPGNSLPRAREGSSAGNARVGASNPNGANGTLRRGGTATRSGDRSAASAWSVVAESMAVKDYARAEGALRELTRSGASDTRDNATLGLAQLALGRGDCTEARRLAQRVLQGAPNPQARRRSEEVLTRCGAP